MTNRDGFNMQHVDFTVQEGKIRVCVPETSSLILLAENGKSGQEP